MTEWREVKLGDVCFYASQKMDTKFLSIYNYISTENMLPNKSGITTSSSLPNITFTPSFEKGDILVSNIRPYFKKIWLAQFDGGCSNDVLVFRANNNTDVKFLYYVLSNDRFFEYSTQTSKGTKMPRGDKTAILNYLVSLPPLEVQKKIAGVLGALDDKIELNNKINQNLEAQAQALFKSWFVDFEPFGGQMPSDWKIGKLADVVDFYNGYPFKSNELLDKNVEEQCLHVFKQGHIKRGGGFNSDSTKSYFPKEKTKDKEKYILKKGDILMAMTDMKGNVAILGNTALMGTSDKFIVNQRVGLLRCKDIYGISYPYIYLLTNSTDFLHDLRNRANSGVQVNLSSQEIKNSELLIPNTETNTVFNTVCKSFFEKIFENEKENLRLAELRDTLLPKLMSGEINVDDVKID